MINIFFALFSILAGILLAEIAYALLLTIEYAMLSSFNFELTLAWHYLKIGAVGGGIMGFGIALLRYFRVKGF
ncbi:hypothetical protein [Rosenbergiella collisarenosi]|uniref:hypothetical protein n=1 Tax=Rosenbergiella collisarenosi TaxID=1544695 RepID=UPI001BDADB3A|nr:hypothetical protein [Rosenbergiella collisarenosi]MBT0722694.1 hypothetical protein [Rosenbergiella collisarenosi]